MASEFVVQEFRQRIIEHLCKSSSDLWHFFHDLTDEETSDFNKSLDSMIDDFLSNNGDRI